MKYLILFILPLVIVSCKSKKELDEIVEESPVVTEETVITQEETTGGKPQRPYQVTAKTGDVQQKTDAYEILSARIEGNILWMDISYTGGCAWHKFEFIGSEAIMKSNPPKRAVKLIHDNDDDTCESLVKQTIQVDISPLAASQTAGSEIVLILEGYSEQLKYIYE